MLFLALFKTEAVALCSAVFDMWVRERWQEKEKEKKEMKDKHDSVCWCKRENPEDRDVWMCAEQQTKTNSLITKLPAGRDR